MRKLSTLDKLDSLMTILEASNRDYMDYTQIVKDIIDKKAEKYAKTPVLEELIEGIDINNLKREIAKNILITAGLKDEVPNSHICKEFYEELKEKQVPYNGVMSYLNRNKEVFERILTVFATNRYLFRVPKKGTRDVKDSVLRNYIYYLEPTNSEKKTSHKPISIKNLIFNQSAKDIATNFQQSLKHADYSLGRHLYASFDIGKEPRSQEDSVLLLEHPSNKKFKLLAVADGHSESPHGEKASNHVMRQILSWFQELDSSYYQNTDELIPLLNNKLRQINVELLSKQDGRATTFTCAIVGEKRTLISSIGDSRAYAIQGKRTERLTRDDSYVQDLCDEGFVRRDEARFHKASHILQKKLGQFETDKMLGIETGTISNDYYDILTLVTDGVTKCIDDRYLAFLAETDDPKRLARRLVLEATTIGSDMGCDKIGYDRTINPGTNNATAAVYVKQLKK